MENTTQDTTYKPEPPIILTKKCTKLTLNIIFPDHAYPNLIPTSKVFSTLLMALTKPILESSASPTHHTNYNKRIPTLRAKKLKALELIDINLNDQDVLFINSLTSADITQLIKKLRVRVSSEGAISKI